MTLPSTFPNMDRHPAQHPATHADPDLPHYADQCGSQTTPTTLGAPTTPDAPARPTAQAEYLALLRARGLAEGPHATDLERRLIPITAILMVAAVALMLVANWRGAWLTMPALGLLGVAVAVVTLASRRGRRAIDDAHHHLCPTCRYPLHDSPPAGTCPECGTPYTHEEIAAIWRGSYGITPATPTNTPVSTPATTSRPVGDDRPG